MFGFSAAMQPCIEDSGLNQVSLEIADISKSLSLDRLNLETLPDTFRALADKPLLQRLDLSHNSFSCLPPEIGLLHQIKELKLCSNMRVPFSIPRAVGNLKNLVNLKLSGNSLTSVPNELGNISGILMIDLSHNNLTRLPTSFSKLVNLIELRVDNNKLSKLPKLSTTMHLLSLSFNSNLSLPRCFQRISILSNLNRLDMRACELTEWPTHINSLSKLQHIDFGCNRIPVLPERCLMSFPLLQNLYLDHNQLTEIPDDIGKVTSLTSLLLSGNDFQEVPLSFRHLSNLKTFTIDEENMLIPPREVVRNGLRAIRSFIESLAEESLPCYRIRLMILGNEVSGKTSLLRRLKSGKSLKKNQSNKDSPTGASQGTKYIDRRIIKLTSKQSDGTNATVDFNTWDFCFGYETFHQFFVAPKSIFIVVIDLREISKDKIRFWLQSISTRAGDAAPIFLVGTHADDKSFKEDGVLSSALNSIAQEFTATFPGIRVITSVSSYDGTGIDELRNALVTEALNQKHVGRIIPKPYALLEDAMRAMNEEKKAAQLPPLVSWSEFTSIGAKCHIHTQSTLRTATTFLRDLGTLITFRDDHSGNHLTPTLVLDPQWICELVTLLGSLENKNGIVKLCDFEGVWKSPLFPTYIHSNCIELLRDNGISFPVSKSLEIIPSLLPLRKPDLQLIWLRDDTSRTQFERVWKFGYIPAGLFSHLLARLAVTTQVHSMWQHGCVISLYGDWALLGEYTHSGCICVAVRSSAPSVPLLDFLTCLITQLFTNYYPRAEYKLQISCAHCVQNRTSDPWYFAVEDCETALLASKSHLSCKHKGTDVPWDIKQLVPDLSLTQNENLKIDIKKIDMEKQILAEGAYGVLYRGIYENEPVAVKILRTEGAELEQQIEIFQEFRKEVSLMSELQHENVVQLKGFCFGSGDIAMVMELVDCGDLHHLIKDKSKTLSMPMSLKIAFDIAQGLHYMHNVPIPILHRDLKPGNILLAHSSTKWKYTAKLADFGLSTRMYFDKLKERAVETPIWLSPEILSSGYYSTPSDVFAFGIILYEMVERKLPYENFDFRFLNQLEEEIIAGNRCDISHIEESNPHIATLISACWQDEPKRRPDFQEVMRIILNISKNLDQELFEHLSSRREQAQTEVVDTSLQVEKQNDAAQVALTGKYIKTVQTQPPETVSCMVVVGKDIWVAHRNGDISIWNSENGTLFRQIITAHSREIQTMILVGNRVWTGSRDGMIHVWKSRSFPEPINDQTNLPSLKEGYLEPADGSPACFVSIRKFTKELVEGVSLYCCQVLPVNDQAKCGFVLTLADGNNVKYFCANAKDRDEWVNAIIYASRNLKEETEDLKVEQIPQKRRVQINSLVYTNGVVWAAVSDLSVRTYDPVTYNFLEEFPFIIVGNWKNATAPQPRSGGKPGNFFSPQSLKPRKQLKSINFGKQRAVGSLSVTENVLATPDKLDPRLQIVADFREYGGFLWAIIHSFILRYSIDDMRPMGQLFHSNQVRAICGVDDHLWSCAEDKTICIWDIMTLQQVKVINTDAVGYSLLRVGPSVWCGAEKQIVVWDIEKYKQQRILVARHSDPVTSLLIVWNRIVWSASLDQTICIWS